MTEPLLLDLGCKAGGAAEGYRRAGFRVVGLDIQRQRHYPFAYMQADMLAAPINLRKVDIIHGSPPCQAFTVARSMNGNDHPDLLTPLREWLETTGKPWIIENVPGAPMRADFVLCGSMFGLPNLIRHRWFETSWKGFRMTPPCNHPAKALWVMGHTGPDKGSVDQWSEAMGIDWMTVDELAQAIPPAFTEFVGAHALRHLRFA